MFAVGVDVDGNVDADVCSEQRDIRNRAEKQGGDGGRARRTCVSFITVHARRYEYVVLLKA